MAGHFTPNKKWTNEAWGLETYPTGNFFITCSDGNFIIFINEIINIYFNNICVLMIINVF